MRQGDKLANGAEVLAYHADANQRVVLANWNGGYATWRLDRNNNTYWPHFHATNEAAARNDYNNRLQTGEWIR